VLRSSPSSYPLGSPQLTRVGLARQNPDIRIAFLETLIRAVPYKIHTVLTDNGIQLTFPPRYADGPTATYMTHMFDMRCHENDIEHRLTKVKHPWTNGQVERMNHTIKEATVKRYHYDNHHQLEAHLADVIAAYNSHVVSRL
jgi:transposase InsO family protein